MERVLNVPCIIDPRKDCPDTCALRGMAIDIIRDKATILSGVLTSKVLDTNTSAAAHSIRGAFERMTDAQRAQYMTNSLLGLILVGVVTRCETVARNSEEETSS